MIIKNDIDSFQAYLLDAANIKGYANSLYIPFDLYELKSIAKELYYNKTPITFRGSGTSTTGSSVPFGGAIISLEKINKIINIDENKLIATVESGVTLEQLGVALSGLNLFYPPNPTEKKATIGGNISTNASGSRSFKYGMTLNNIDSVDGLFFENNSLIEKSFKIKSPQYNPDVLKSASCFRLSKNIYSSLIGGEGTVGIISNAELRLKPSPEQLFNLFIFFDNSSRALDFIAEIRRLVINSNQFIHPMSIEYFDRKSMVLIFDDDFVINNDQICCGIWCEQELETDNYEIILDKWYELILQYSKYVNDTIAGSEISLSTKIEKIRHNLPEKINEKVSKNNQKKIGTDTAVPHRNFKQYYDFVYNLLENQNVEYYIFGHFGNSHLHANLLPTNEYEYNMAQNIYEKLMLKAIELGGTISAEHGIGKLKNTYFRQMISEENYKRMIDIKFQLDKYNLLCRGNIF